MLKWLRRAINSNYKDLQGANKGLRRLSRKVKFAEMDLEMWQRKYNWLCERHDALLEQLNAKEDREAKPLPEAKQAGEEDQQRNGFMANRNGHQATQRECKGISAESAHLSVLQGCCAVEGTEPRPQDTTV